MRTYGYDDPEIVRRPKKTFSTYISIFLAILFIVAVWLALDQKLLFGKAWLSQTYDNPEWRTNEGNLHTFGAWDLETHVWKTEYIMKYFPNFQWNPYWYLGMPLLKYYQLGFYVVHWLTIVATGLSAPRAALVMIIFAHLLATLLTFYLCYKVSGRVWISAFTSTFLLSNTFISLRSYGWEPITVVFLFLYPLGLLLFLKNPLKPFRLSMIILLALSYLSHPLLWFSLCMTMGLYLLIIAIHDRKTSRYLWSYLFTVLFSILVGAVQFIPQLSYHQVTSGAHMGVTYLPYYQVPYNIITLKDFLFDAGNLKGPGPIVMIALFFLLLFAFLDYRRRRTQQYVKGYFDNQLLVGLSFVLFMMVAFYYMELYNIFPMNFFRSVQYHRIIPEFIVAAAVLVSAFSNLLISKPRRVIYNSMLVAFTFASFIIIFNVQARWQTTDTITDRPEFIKNDFAGRVTVPYTDQSFAVRNSFTQIPQVYGYYEQGITNAYDDEMFSVSSGYQNANNTIIYLKAADVSRIYVNMEEGQRDGIMRSRLNESLRFVVTNNSRYAYFEVPLADPSMGEAVSGHQADIVQALKPGCRVLFTDNYCNSDKEEFVGTDPTEIRYLAAYVNMLEQANTAHADFTMHDPEHYLISVSNAASDTAIVVKMSYDPDFTATVDGRKLPIEKIGPDFMLIRPGRSGSYDVELTYHTSKFIIAGAIVSTLSLLGLLVYFLIHPSFDFLFRMKAGDLFRGVSNDK